MRFLWIFSMLVDELKRTWPCIVFGHNMPYKVHRSPAGKSFLEVLPCRHCGHTVTIK